MYNGSSAVCWLELCSSVRTLHMSTCSLTRAHKAQHIGRQLQVNAVNDHLQVCELEVKLQLSDVEVRLQVVECASTSAISASLLASLALSSSIS
jgi:hypothetical protein